ncbi:MAG: hypothetical protein ACRDK4_11630 [Solirubrobacteraceae bacterium]
MIKPKLSYANVTATLALFFAMTGGALAAHHYLITSTKQISPKVVKALKGKTGPAGPQGIPGKDGAAGKDGKEGPLGPSKAFNTNSGTDILSFPSTSNEKLTVASIALPAGNFSLLAKLIANNNGTSTLVHCELLLGGTVIDPGFDGISLGEVPADRHYLVLAGTGSLASPGTAEVVCTVSSTSGNYLDRSITAVQVGSLG